MAEYDRSFKSGRQSELLYNEELHKNFEATRHLLDEPEGKTSEPKAKVNGALWLDKKKNELKRFVGSNGHGTWKRIFDDQFRIVGENLNPVMPEKPVLGQMWFYNDILMFYNGAEWRPAKALQQDASQINLAIFENFALISPITTVGSTVVNDEVMQHYKERLKQYQNGKIDFEANSNISGDGSKWDFNHECYTNEIFPRDLELFEKSQILIPNAKVDKLFLDHKLDFSYDKKSDVCIEYNKNDIKDKVATLVHINPGHLKKITKRLVKVDRINPHIEISAYNTEFYGFKGLIIGDYEQDDIGYVPPKEKVPLSERCGALLRPKSNDPENYDYETMSDGIYLTYDACHSYDYVLAVTYEFSSINSEGSMELNRDIMHTNSYYVQDFKGKMNVFVQGYELEDPYFKEDSLAKTVTIDDDAEGKEISIMSSPQREFGIVRMTDLNNRAIIKTVRKYKSPLIFMNGEALHPLLGNVERELNDPARENYFYVKNGKRDMSWCVMELCDQPEVVERMYLKIEPNSTATYNVKDFNRAIYILKNVHVVPDVHDLKLDAQAAKHTDYARRLNNNWKYDEEKGTVTITNNEDTVLPITVVYRYAEASYDMFHSVGFVQDTETIEDKKGTKRTFPVIRINPKEWASERLTNEYITPILFIEGLILKKENVFMHIDKENNTGYISLVDVDKITDYLNDEEWEIKTFEKLFEVYPEVIPQFENNFKIGQDYILLQDKNNRFYNESQLQPAMSIGNFSDSLVYVNGMLVCNDASVRTTKKESDLKEMSVELANNEVKFFVTKLDSGEEIVNKKVWNKTDEVWESVSEEEGKGLESFVSNYSNNQRSIQFNEKYFPVEKDDEIVVYAYSYSKDTIPHLVIRSIDCPLEEADDLQRAYKDALESENKDEIESTKKALEKYLEQNRIFATETIYHPNKGELSVWINGIRQYNIDECDSTHFIIPEAIAGRITYVIEKMSNQSNEFDDYDNITNVAEREILNKNNAIPGTINCYRTETALYPGKLTVYVDGIRQPSDAYTIIDCNTLAFTDKNTKLIGSNITMPYEVILDEDNEEKKVYHSTDTKILIEVRRNCKRKENVTQLEGKEFSDIDIHKHDLPPEILDCNDEIMIFVNGFFFGLKDNQGYVKDLFEEKIRITDNDVIAKIFDDPLESYLATHPAAAEEYEKQYKKPFKRSPKTLLLDWR